MVASGEVEGLISFGIPELWSLVALLMSKDWRLILGQPFVSPCLLCRVPHGYS